MHEDMMIAEAMLLFQHCRVFWQYQNMQIYGVIRDL